MTNEIWDDPELQDPDSNNTGSQFTWDEEFQRTIICLLLMDRTFLLQSIDLIKPNYFTNKAHQKACETVFEHFKKYKYAPTRIELVQELKEKFKEDKSALYFINEIKTLYDYFEPNIESREYLTDKVAFFAKIQALRQAFSKSLKEIDKAPESEETWAKIYDMLREAMNTDRNFDMGLEYFKTIKERYEDMGKQEENTEYFTTGYEDLDNQIKGGGYIRGEMLGVVAGSGVGKCFKINTLIRMFDGTTKFVQDIKIGDLVMGDDSKPRKVLRLARGKDQMYEIKPTKGESYVVNSEHVLSLKSCSKTIDIKNRCKNVRYFNSPWRSKDGIFDIPVKEYLKLSKRMQKTLKGYRVGVEYQEQDMKIPPYILGIWLGDGTSLKPQVTSAAQPVVNEMIKYAESRGMKISKTDGDSLASLYSIINIDHKPFQLNPFLQDLKTINVFGNKHIPENYMINNRSNRLELLAGLIDTDGYQIHNCYEFVNKNMTLAENVLVLARSLGFAAHYGKDKVVKNQIYKRVFISGDLSEVPVRIEYKKCMKREQIKDHLVTGITVSPIGEDNYYGFETDGNHRFLLSDFTVVHNSICMACISAHNLKLGKNVLYISLELTQERVAERFDSILTGLPIHCLYDVKNDVFDKLEGIVKSKEDKNVMLIKQFPSASADVNTIRAYLSQLSFYGFKPDVVVVDYVGEMKDTPGLPTHESRERMVKELRGLAGESNVFMVTAFQPNRTSKELQENGGVIEEEHLADSFGQIRPLDGCVSLNQNKNENSVNIGRMWVIKQRNGKSRYMLYLRFDPENLRISQIHHDTYKDLNSRKKDGISESVEKDMMDKIIKGVESPEAAAKEAAKFATNYIPPDDDDE